MSEWKPIETIPNSGDKVIVWDGKTIITMRADDWHHTPKPSWLWQATHWMPLPAPPKEVG